jgi:hypothetical protein
MSFPRMRGGALFCADSARMKSRFCAVSVRTTQASPFPVPIESERRYTLKRGLSTAQAEE